MIDTLIFDFGNVFIDLDLEEGLKTTLKDLDVENLPPVTVKINEAYEVGAISTDAFILHYTSTFKNLNRDAFIKLWNLILKTFPKHRLEFLQQLKATGKYKLILLSNTNTLHIDWIKQHVPFYNAFKACFDAFYLSHEIKLRKPNETIFQFVLSTHHLKPETCLFIDDNSDNIATAKRLNIKTWHITPYKEDVADLFTVKALLF